MRIDPVIALWLSNLCFAVVWVILVRFLYYAIDSGWPWRIWRR
jgi:hypothetical protein